jgi:hypothetical protein
MKEQPCAIKFRTDDAAFRFYLEFRNSVPFRVRGISTLVLPASPDVALKNEPETYRVLKELEAEGLAKEVVFVPARGAWRFPSPERTRQILRGFADERPRERAFLERLRVALGER